jgi:hypothetical protein
MQTPHSDTYPVIQKSSVLPDVFLDILRLKVGSLQWLGPMLTPPFFLAVLILRFTNCHQKMSKSAKKSLIALAQDTIHPRKKLLRQKIHDFRF